MERLSKEEIEDGLGGLDGWAMSDSKIKKVYEFGSFNEAFGFMTRAAMEIEKMNHHPEWLNVYNRITVELTTHDAGGITQNDLKLARILDSLA
ncbi:MAG: 4a-hydroxytetrahydrobiopterin dehydratase [Nitrosopumilus sp. H8]|nr:MAG: 4a-hydroxytetrahydrobiopterin dehydratase [Nitrosopumilus sp. H8]